MPEEEILPTWAPRVTKRKIKQLYDDDARGMHDEELIEDVGYSLLSRCDSFIAANEARAGSVRCPSCEASVSHNRGDP